jgi:hypothetical protein
MTTPVAHRDVTSRYAEGDTWQASSASGRQGLRATAVGHSGPSTCGPADGFLSSKGVPEGFQEDTQTQPLLTLWQNNTKI